MLSNQECIFGWNLEDGIETLSFFCSCSARGWRKPRYLIKKCEEKNSLRNICSGNYRQRWFQILSALSSVNTFSQSFHEGEGHYLLWFKTLSTECIFLLFTLQSKQPVHLFCCNQSHINQHKLKNEQSSQLLTQTNSLCILSLPELP